MESATRSRENPPNSRTRAPLRPEVAQMRERLYGILPLLEAEPHWYGSLFFERKASRSLWANLKQTQMAEQISMGTVLRIYDGSTLYEQATDALDAASLKSAAEQIVLRVRTASATGATKPPRPYRPVTWADRLARPLDPEIRSQIPDEVLAGAGARRPVHFGVRFEQSPVEETPIATFERLRALVDRCKRLAPSAGLDPAALSYILARHSFSEEASLFIDRESNLSQALYRTALTIVTMSGSDRTYARLGGLGGLEITNVEDREILELLEGLQAMKSAARLTPGKYRVLFSPALAGVLAHEAFGHAQEGDTCARGRSKAWELHKSGESVGNQHATILNNPAIFANGDQAYAAWGSYYFDEEGWLAEEQVLLEKGRLKAPMTNLTSALRLAVPRTANGKRESWANGVYTRQTNTYFSAGDRTLAQLMSELGDGFLAEHTAGGMEDPKGMGIQVGISFLREVKAGKLTGRLFKGPAGGDIQMTGYTPDVLHSIVAKSKIEYATDTPDRARHPFNDAGGCGKYHKEIVYAGCGGPYLLLDGVILG